MGPGIARASRMGWLLSAYEKAIVAVDDAKGKIDEGI